MISDDIMPIFKDYEEEIDSDYFSKGKIFEYLQSHDIVEKDIFSEALLTKDEALRELSLGRILGFMPIEVETFVFRMPLYFMVCFEDGKEDEPIIYSIFELIGNYAKPMDIFAAKKYKYYTNEEMFEALTDMYIMWCIDVIDMVNYIPKVEAVLPDENMNGIMIWHDYVKRCVEHHNYNFTPDYFIYEYNTILEKDGQEPIKFPIKTINELEDQPDWIEITPEDFIEKVSDHIAIKGKFPSDPNGNVVLRWINILIKNPGGVKSFHDENEKIIGEVWFGVSPTMELYVKNLFPEDEYKGKNEWYRLYTGPRMMAFDYKVLKKYRTENNMTQQNVADAVGTTLRTYQKWEKGETTPDCDYLLRLMNWLNIKSPKDATAWRKDWDATEQT